MGCLSMPSLVNTLVYVEFIDRQCYSSYAHRLVIVESPSSYCQLVSWGKKIGGEEVLALVHRNWSKRYEAMVRLHSDRDIRFTSKNGWWRKASKAITLKFCSASHTLHNSTGPVTERTGKADKCSGS